MTLISRAHCRHDEFMVYVRTVSVYRAL